MSSFIPSCTYVAKASSSPSAWTEPAYALMNQATQRNARFDDVLTAEGWFKRQNDLKVIRRYRDDWDGMGASAPQPQLIDAAIRLLQNMQRSDEGLTPPSAVSGTAMGHVTIEWHMGPVYLEVELIDPHHVEWMMERDGKFSEWTRSIYDQSIEDQLVGSPISNATLGSEAKGKMWPSSSASVPDMKSFQLR